MKVVDYENWTWFLFEHQNELYLDVHCNMSAFGYTYMIQLNDTERELYETEGREYLCKLAHDIHYSVPIAKDTSSIYKERNVTKEFSNLTREAVRVWREHANDKNT